MVTSPVADRVVNAPLDAVEAPIVVPLIEPPATATLFASCVAIEPKPKLVLAVEPDSVTKLVPLPTMKLLSAGVNPATSAS